MTSSKTDIHRRKPTLSKANKCPRCGQYKLFTENVFNSRSKTHQGVIICNYCGNDEGLVLAGYPLDDKAKQRQIIWENKKL